jgi:pantoate--beta-alanine ligase
VKICRDIAGVHRLVRRWRRGGSRIAVVPTMGNLHRGHVALMQLAQRHADRVIATIFVNPTQFGPREDYERYPRTLSPDTRKLRSAGVAALFVPDVAEIYPRGKDTSTVVTVPGLSADLCGEFRPVHFSGVASVVLRLFNITTPDVAVFGEKDFQQLVIVRRMVSDLHLPVRVVGAKTMREPDGLALSSRNQYLTVAQRLRAPLLNATLRAASLALREGKGDVRSVEREGMRALRKAGFDPDYFAVRMAATLQRPVSLRGELRILAAAWLGKARLIDNIGVRL